MQSSGESTISQQYRSIVLRNLADVSVIVPIGPGDELWRELMLDLGLLPPESDIFLVGADPEPSDFQSLQSQSKIAGQTRWIETSPGRARQMNRGAELAQRKYVWFLHADSRVPRHAFQKLDQALGEDADALMYFDLEYRHDGPSAARWNARGVRFRSRVLGMPFGDQGYCLRRETFHRLGGFNEAAHRGEDHLLVWSARQQGIKLRAIDSTISTSARKYARDGWLRTTLVHLWHTFQQALPQWWKLVTRKRQR